jgi:hypothetical protein
MKPCYQSLLTSPIGTLRILASEDFDAVIAHIRESVESQSNE